MVGDDAAIGIAAGGGVEGYGGADVDLLIGAGVGGGRGVDAVVGVAVVGVAIIGVVRADLTRADIFGRGAGY